MIRNRFKDPSEAYRYALSLQGTPEYAKFLKTVSQVSFVENDHYYCSHECYDIEEIKEYNMASFTDDEFDGELVDGDLDPPLNSITIANELFVLNNEPEENFVEVETKQGKEVKVITQQKIITSDMDVFTTVNSGKFVEWFGNSAHLCIDPVKAAIYTYFGKHTMSIFQPNASLGEKEFVPYGPQILGIFRHRIVVIDRKLLFNIRKIWKAIKKKQNRIEIQQMVINVMEEFFKKNFHVPVVLKPNIEDRNGHSHVTYPFGYLPSEEFISWTKKVISFADST